MHHICVQSKSTEITVDIFYCTFWIFSFTYKYIAAHQKHFINRCSFPMLLGVYVKSISADPHYTFLWRQLSFKFKLRYYYRNNRHSFVKIKTIMSSRSVFSQLANCFTGARIRSQRIPYVHVEIPVIHNLWPASSSRC